MGVWLYEVDNRDIVDYVERQVLMSNGKGFSRQLFPEITKHKALNGHVPLFGKKYWYRPDILEGPRERAEEILKTCRLEPPVDWNAVISDDVEKFGNKLPTGITIQKSEIVVLRDERIKEEWHRPMSLTHDKANYIEGRRVYISVSDEYAAKVFKDTYTDPGVKFRDLLLTKYEYILKEVASSIDNNFRINKFETDFIMGEGSGIDIDVIFKKFDMQPLGSWGQRYGMVLAIIETLKKYDLKYKSAVFTMRAICFADRAFKTGMQVNIRIPKPVETQTQKELKPW